MSVVATGPGQSPFRGARGGRLMLLSVDGLPPPGHFVGRKYPGTAGSEFLSTDRRRFPMSRPLVLPALTQFVAATAGRNMTRAAYIAVSAGVVLMVLLTVNPSEEAGHLMDQVAAVGVPGVFHFRMGGPAAPCRSGRTRAGLRVFRPRAGGRRRRHRGSDRPDVRRQSQDRVAARRAVAPEGDPRHSRIAPVAPGASAGVRAAVERAGDLPDGAVSGLGSGVLFRARRAAGDLRQHPRRAMVGGGDPDHHRLWRCGADHAVRPGGRGPL